MHPVGDQSQVVSPRDLFGIVLFNIFLDDMDESATSKFTDYKWGQSIDLLEGRKALQRNMEQLH